MDRRDVEFFLGDSELTAEDIDFILNEDPTIEWGHGDYTITSFLDGEGVIFQARNRKTGKRYGFCYSVASARELCKQLHANDMLAEMGF